MHWQNPRGRSLDTPLRYDSELTLASLISGAITSVGICDRCERGSEELADGWCPACWAQRERELRALPNEPRVITKPRKQVKFATVDLDETVQPEKVEQVIRKPGVMPKAHKHETEFVVGPKPFLSQRGKKGLSKMVPRKGQVDWTYMGSPTGRTPTKYRRGDEKFTDEAWMHDGIAALTKEA